MLSKEAVVVLRHYRDEGLSQTAIAQKLRISRRTVYRYVKSGKAKPSYTPRPRRPSPLDSFKEYLRGRLEAYPDLSAVRLLREIRELGYRGGYTIVKDFVRTQRSSVPPPLEQRF